MEPSAFLNSFFALLFVLALIGVVSLLLKKYGPEKFLFAGKVRTAAERRLKVIETLTLDSKRKIVLLKRDNTEHLVLLSEGRDVVIERSIKPAKPPKRKK